MFFVFGARNNSCVIAVLPRLGLLERAALHRQQTAVVAATDADLETHRVVRPHDEERSYGRLLTNASTIADGLLQLMCVAVVARRHAASPPPLRSCVWTV